MTILTTRELATVGGGISFELPIGPPHDLKLMARRGFTDPTLYQRFRFIMQGIAGYPPIKEY